MKSLLSLGIAVLVMCMCFAPGCSEDDDVNTPVVKPPPMTGTWDIHLENSDEDWKLVIGENDGKLSGTLEIYTELVKDISGTCSDGGIVYLSFTDILYQDEPARGVFDGTCNDSRSEFSGTFSIKQAQTGAEITRETYNAKKR
jgi:hypothetical protein